jgi:magnesium and cobalt transporter
MSDGSPAQKPRDGEGSGLMGLLRGLLGSRETSDNFRDAIEELIDQEGEEAGANSSEIALLRNILRVRDLAVYDVMVPRADIVAVEAETAVETVAKMMSESTHSRLPVYRGQLDDIIGMVHIKDLLASWEKSHAAPIKSIVRRPLFVAPSMPVLELLLQMRVQRMHMAFVIDEFGGIDGLVTIEDLVEEIVGEIEDEHDDERSTNMIRRIGDGLDIDARLEIDDFEEEFGPVLTDEEREADIDTVGGLVFYVAGRVPGRGEVIRHEGGVEFEVLDADPRRIRRLRVTRPQARDQE